MAEDPSVTIKTTPEVKAKYDELKVKSGLNSKEFFDFMLAQYEVNSMGQDVEQSVDLPQVKAHLLSLEAIFLSQIQKGIDTNQFFKTKIAQENELHKTIVDDLQQAKAEAIADRDVEEARRIESDSYAGKLAVRNEELETQSNTDKSTIANFTHRNEDLEAERIETRSYVADMTGRIKTLESERHELENRLNLVVKENESMDRELKASVEKASKAQTEMNDKITLLIAGHEKELAQLAKTNELMLANEKGEAERRVLQETQKLKDEMHRAIEEQGREHNTEKNELHKTIDELNKRIFELLGAKETKKTEGKKAVT